jgi:F-type H+-transporting ATPase subunit a
VTVRLVWLSMLAVATVARAEEEHGEKVDTTSYILHHVTDEQEFGFQIPLSDKEVFLRFPTWRIPLKAGACPANEEEEAKLSEGCLDISLTKHAFMLFVGALVVILIFALGANRDLAQPVPHGARQNLLEMLVLFVRNDIAIPNIGREKGPTYTPYLLSIFFFILTLNLLGLVPWAATATSNLAVTAALAACTFVLTQAASIRSAGLGGYLAHLTEGAPWWLWPIMVPVEVLGLFTKPFALTLRLFANMLAGHIVLFSMLGLIFIIGHTAVAVVAVPFAVGIYLLELFVAFLQAYIFTMLSSLFIGMGVAMGHDTEPHEESHANPAVAPG